MNRFNSRVSDRSIEIKKNFKTTLKLDKFKKSDFDKSQNIVNKTQKKRFAKSRETNNESDKLQNNFKSKLFIIRIKITNSLFDINVTNSIITLFINNNCKLLSQFQLKLSSDNITNYTAKLAKIQKFNAKLEVKQQYKLKLTKFKIFKEFIIEKKLKFLNEFVFFFRFVFKKRSKNIITKNKSDFDNNQSALKKKFINYDLTS